MFVLGIIVLFGMNYEIKVRLRDEYPEEYLRAGKPSLIISDHRTITFYTYILFREYKRLTDKELIRKLEISRTALIVLLCCFILVGIATVISL